MAGALPRPIRVYADTSVYGGVFDDEFAKASKEFFGQVREGRFALVVSPLIEDELAPAPAAVRAFFRRIRRGAELAGPLEEAVFLREAYLRTGVVGRSSLADALHVAMATVSGCRMIVSWNFHHIVHCDKIPLYNAVNIVAGYGSIAIHSPPEVTSHED